jgi:hypothetical protein
LSSNPVSGAVSRTNRTGRSAGERPRLSRPPVPGRRGGSDVGEPRTAAETAAGTAATGPRRNAHPHPPGSPGHRAPSGRRSLSPCRSAADVGGAPYGAVPDAAASIRPADRVRRPGPRACLPATDLLCDLLERNPAVRSPGSTAPRGAVAGARAPVGRRRATDRDRDTGPSARRYPGSGGTSRRVGNEPTGTGKHGGAGETRASSSPPPHRARRGP